MALSAIGFFFSPSRDWTTLWIVEAVLLVVFVADAAAGVSPSRIVVFRDHADAITLGETATLTWTLENNARTPAGVTITDALWPSHLRQPPSWIAFMREMDADWRRYMREHDSPDALHRKDAN